MAEGSSTFFLLLRMALSLAIVLGGVSLAVRVLRRRGLDRGASARGRTDRLVVLDRRSLTKGAHVALVRLGEQDLLLGVTDRRVEVLGRTGPEVPHDARAVAPTTTDASAPERVIDVTAGPPPPLAALEETTGTRRTGFPTPADAAGTESRMGFVEALRELTVRRS